MKTKRKKYLQRFGIQIAWVAFFVLAAGLTGCMSREARFLEEGELLQESDISPTEHAVREKPAEEAAGETSEKEQSVSLDETDVIQSVIYVDVCGAVVNPGVYCLPENSRIFQAIEEAGGFAPEADENYTNRAGILSDGQQIYIPTREETQELEQPVQIHPETQLSQGAADARVNINTADESQLTTLTGIGATRAQAIIAYRQQHGAFASVEEIMNVQGIKEGTFAKIKDDIVV